MIYGPPMFAPSLSLEAFQEYAARGASVIPLEISLSSDHLTPVLALETLAPEGDAFLLESVVGGESWARYSFVGFAPEVRVRGDQRGLEIDDGLTKKFHAGDPFSALRDVLSQWKPPQELSANLPPFWGGAVGAIPYSAAHAFEPASGQRRGRELEFGLGHTVAVFDSWGQRLRLIKPVRIDSRGVDACYQNGIRQLREAKEKLASPVQLPALPPPGAAPDSVPPSSFRHEEFLAAVESAKEYIRAGDIFQVVLSQRLEVDASDIRPIDLYRALRMINPSPYMYFLRMGETEIAGASPETLVRVQDGEATLRPIAGTRRRTGDADTDQALAEELLADPKERAEHVMLVDLGRNDLGRIAKTGSVTIDEAMAIEHFSHVMHMTSTLRATLKDGADAIDVLRATFPAGTLSGAPKVRAMQIIDELEPCDRGYYGGAIGYFSFDGNADFAIAIRTLVSENGKLSVQAGAGIVEASDPQLEYEETLHKARANLVALVCAAQR